MKTFGDRLRQLRTQHDFSQRELAKLVGCDYTYISKLENNTATYAPSEEMTGCLASLLGVDAEELIFSAGKIPSAYNGLLEKLALKYGTELPGVLEKLLEGEA